MLPVAWLDRQMAGERRCLGRAALGRLTRVKVPLQSAHGQMAAVAPRMWCVMAHSCMLRRHVVRRPTRPSVSPSTFLRRRFDPRRACGGAAS